jgi:predicted branched-subunit amino acid permease
VSDRQPKDGWGELRAGAVAILPAAIAVIPFALLLGALADKKGLTALEVALMSGLVFAGSSQLVGIDLWRDPAPWGLLALTTLTVNLRHVMMSASIARHMNGYPQGGRWLALFFLADEIWAMAERRAADRGGLSPAFYAGLALTLYLNWVVWTAAGTALGALVANPAAWGFDFAFTAIFIGLIAGFWKGRATGVVVAVSALTAVLVERTAGGVWHIVAGGTAGIVAAAAIAARIQGNRAR